VAEELNLRRVPALIVVLADVERHVRVFHRAHEEASPSLVSGLALLVQQCQALSARHRGPVVGRDALHLGAMGGLLVTRVT